MIIRKAKLEDVKQCEEISRTKELMMPDGSTPSVGQFERCTEKIFLVAEEENKILGLILGHALSKKVVYLDLIVVHKDFRNKKIGEQLLEAFKKEIKKQGIVHYFLYAASFNEKTLDFYRKHQLIEGKQYTLFCQDI